MIAKKKKKPINALAVEIDTIRGVDNGLASAIRLFVLSEILGRPFS
ncbi:MAG: ribbon-helix-helix domain-containing protein [Planktomarina sp.]|nr:ribbon-helix-helix domain-containing protein [Planktomarina sp.]